MFIKSWDEYKEYMHWYSVDGDGFGSVFAYLAVFNLINWLIACFMNIAGLIPFIGTPLNVLATIGAWIYIDYLSIETDYNNYYGEEFSWLRWTSEEYWLEMFDWHM